ncbi:bifunctional 23S rRNA (guanine(2069)-N(7))-methyltransferase RlmK/23S rRNA (guanine(2445)-N(2))-methyltransferase RlmL [Sulfurivermis fontis]|uniref:bifunctional 23S rRNA (guanine(2069)-N(7))-methyltransferase RlmK/23S rRNA (guanine(2445)-N(2))-methyltransferase RlmL n=1 Tax=Sulfurivermis fontis TaxID=1972068 RepID=UPI000FD98E73|nr:bifunctional 23S rRNA (guanine(2069)-N(7))-methyltransferase RlmK/23S rRNA (guanine(2445)-N(2))-methyltransferase RlmL [Sulfurivermis fontis]
MKFFATAPRGLTAALADELRRLGAAKVQPGGSGVTFEGSLETAYRVCLWSRLANRVLLPITTVRAPTPEWLYEAVKEIRWEKHLRSSGSLAIDITATDAAISHSQYAVLKTKDAIVDRFRDLFGERPSIDTDIPDLRLHLHLRGEQARISIDLSGGSLHRRGYRRDSVTAPLKENLAAGILQLAGWPAIAARGGALLDPMCGSGTLLIEGALMAADIAPGLQRDYFGFMYWRRHEREVWEKLLEEAKQRRAAGLKNLPPIYGWDQDAAAVAAARANIDEAGLSDYIQVERRALAPGLRALLPEDLQPGLLAVNPPYGERIGEVNALRADYARLGEIVRDELPGFHLSLFTGNPELAGYLPLAQQLSIALYNGPIECQLFNYAPAGTAGEKPALSAGAESFANRLRKNLKHLGRWAERNGVDCYRLYDADLPEYAIAVDLYHSERLWVHVQEYQAPKSVEPSRAQQRLREALSVIPTLLHIPPTQMHFKVRQPQKGRAQYEKLAARGRFHEVREGKCRLLVNFTDYLDTGLFLDHRITRQMIEDEAKGKRFLNLFAYTGSASVHAAMGGAVATTTVDMSKTYLGWAERNMQLNGFTGREHEYIQADCTTWLQDEAALGKRKYDLIFIDPPTFSNSKRMANVFDVQRDHVWLIRQALQLLAPGGTLYFSNNYRKFRLDEQALAGIAIEDITAHTIPEDFKRNHRIHQCWRITRG